ncbi:hypothetical protein M0802_007819 [Mischocyttarus mexicanus]|nr:hypothetical protein M0802_007819 [Mischocyttarus mexicanus]
MTMTMTATMTTMTTMTMTMTTTTTTNILNLEGCLRPLAPTSPSQRRAIRPGTRGEHSQSEDFVYDVSNIRRLGLTEWESFTRNEKRRGRIDKAGKAFRACNVITHNAASKTATATIVDEDENEDEVPV